MPFLICLLLASQVESPEVDAERFLGIMEGLHQPVEDISLVFEGDFRFVGPEDLLGDRQARFLQDFQGTYVYRADGASFLDVYTNQRGPRSRMVRSKDAILRDRAEVFSHVPDADRTPGRIIETAGGPGLLDRPCSPERILFFWFFKEAVFDRYRFEDRGWEDVEGHPCRKVSFHVDVGPAHARREEVFWIDLERGGHPLRMDVLQGGQLASRTHSIRLEQTHPSDGAVFWLPRSGITESYSWNGNLRREPVFREAYHVVKGSVRINRGYPDRVFTARWDGTVAGASALDPARRAFTAALAQQPASDPPPRTDPEGVAEELERRLAEADSQAAMIEVSNSARVEWWRTLVAQGLAIGLGGALIGVAILLRRRA